MRSVAAIGDVLDINCWSNIPYYFFEKGKEMAAFQHPWRVQVEKANSKRILWNLIQIVKARGKGGFQFTNIFLAEIEKQIPKALFSDQVISFSQIFPRARSVKNMGGQIFYYIDTTLFDYFKDPYYDIKIGADSRKHAITLETENYTLADKIVTMSSWVKDSLIKNYHIDPSKIRVILPGANLPDSAILRIQKELSLKNNAVTPFILGFVGKDWKRKGLEELVQIAEILVGCGINVRIRVIGHCPEHIAKHSLILNSGFVDKKTELPKFINELNSCDLGCLFSKGEALGISTLEFLRLGIPVSGYYHQGLMDTLLEGASVRFGLDDNIQKIANNLGAIIKDRKKMSLLNNNAEKYSDFVSWSRCVKEWEVLLNE